MKAFMLTQICICTCNNLHGDSFDFVPIFLISSMYYQYIKHTSAGSFCENDRNSAASKWVDSANMTKKDVDMKEQNIPFELTGHSGDISRRVIDGHTVLNSTLDDTFNMLRNAQLEMLIGNGDRENQVYSLDITFYLFICIIFNMGFQFI